MTKTERHNAKYLAEIFGSVIENAANMKVALILLKEKHPHIVPLGCIAHLLHLLCADILGCQTVKSFFAAVITIVKTIKNSHILKALFDEISSEKSLKDRISLKLPGQTRRGSHLFCLESLQLNKVVLQTLAGNEKANLDPSIKRKLLDDAVFWVIIEKMINLLKPILLILSHPFNQIHRVVRKLNELEKSIKEDLPTSPMEKSEEKKVMKKFIERKIICTGPVHLAAFMLDPKMQGSLLNPMELIDAIGFVCDCALQMGLDVLKVRESLADYRDMEGLFSRKVFFFFFGKGWTIRIKIIRALSWCRALGGTCDLADVAIRILEAPVTSGATEHTFSMFSWLHSKKRNRLSSEQAAKLTFLSYNWKLMKERNKQAEANPEETGGQEEDEEILEIEEDDEIESSNSNDDNEFFGLVNEEQKDQHDLMDIESDSD